MSSARDLKQKFVSTIVALDLAMGRLVRPFGDAVDCELAYYLIQS
jgi:hypothetical protein